MPIEIHSPQRCAAANAARSKAAYKHKILKHIAAHYVKTGAALSQADITAALGIPKDSVNRAIRELRHEEKIHCIGLAGDTSRVDLPMNVKLYGPVSAPVIPRSLDGGSAQRVPKYPRKASERKPDALHAPRVKTPKYKGEVGYQYVPEFKPMTDRPFWLARDLALLAR